MSNLILNGEDHEPEDQEGDLKYPATEVDEEKFFLVYNMKLSVSEVDAMDEDRRKWFIARFIAQKHMEQEMMQQHRMNQAIMSNINNTDLKNPPGFNPRGR